MVEYKKGVENVAANALSRRSEEDSPPLNNRGISIVVPSWLEAVKSMVQNSPFFAHLKQQWEEGRLNDKYYRKADELWGIDRSFLLTKEQDRDLISPCQISHNRISEATSLAL